MPRAANTLCMMKQSRPTILLTRPAPQSQRFAGQIAAQIGAVDVVIAPLFQPRFLAIPQPDPAPSAVIFTSETGVDGAVAAGHTGQGRTAFCVGSRTAQAAKEAGYVAHDAQGDWRDLAALIQAHCPRGPLAFFCAVEAQAHLQSALDSAGYQVQRLEAYAQVPQDFAEDAQAILAQDAPVILPVFSPRSASVLSAHVQQAAAPLWLAAISAASAAAFTAQTHGQIVADRPNAAAMLLAITKLLQELRDNGWTA